MPYMHIDFDLSETDDDELIDELKSRGFKVIEDETGIVHDHFMNIYQLRRCGLQYDHLMDAYIYEMLGKVI